MKYNRRDFLKASGIGAAALAAPALFSGPARAERAKALNILCWEGYNSPEKTKELA